MSEPFFVQKKHAFTVVNVIGCILFLCLPLIMIRREEPISAYQYLGYCVTLTMYLAVFYANYFVLIPRFVFQRRWRIFFGINLFLVAVAVLLLQYLYEALFIHMDQQRLPPPEAVKVLFAFKDAIFMMLVAGVAVAIKMTVQWMRSEHAKTRIEAEASEAELKNLKNQLNPHFLFNTLNNIYSLIGTDTRKAQHAVLGLSKILRYVLYDDNQRLVPLEKDLAFTRSYIDLMSLRINECVALRVNFPSQSNGEQIAPLLFMSLVENAFKHGVSLSEPSFIEIDVTLAEEELVCVVKNSCFPKDDRDKSGSGIGLDNLRRRLELLYPLRHSFVTRLDGNCYVAELKIKWNE